MTISFAAEGSMTKIKEEGKLRQEGRDYVMQDGDIVEFKFNVFQVGSSDPRKRRDSKGSGVSERWNRAVFRFAETAVLRTYSAVLRGDRV